MQLAFVCVPAFASPAIFDYNCPYVDGHMGGTLFNTHLLITPEMLNFEKGNYYIFNLLHNECHMQRLIRGNLIDSKITQPFSCPLSLPQLTDPFRPILRVSTRSQQHLSPARTGTHTHNNHDVIKGFLLMEWIASFN